MDPASPNGRDEGLTDAQIDAATDRPRRCGRPLERTLLTAVDEMIDDFAVGDETWAGPGRFLRPAELLELLFVIGGYVCLAAVLNSIGLRGDIPEAS